jgi:acetyltransferase-like isoleucine patch superfamily enzyme
MGKFVQQLKRIFRYKTGNRSLQNFEHQQANFRKRYPHYAIGIGTYGMPKVHDDEEGTTLQIGAFCSISSEVQIFLGKNHRVDWISSYPFPAFFEQAQHIQNFGVSRGNVTIGSDVWLCANCIILSGVTIGHGAVVGAGAVVSRDVAPYSIVAGNPAKHVRWRFEESIRKKLLETAWWDWPTNELCGIVEILCSDRVHELFVYADKRIS